MQPSISLKISPSATPTDLRAERVGEVRRLKPRPFGSILPLRVEGVSFVRDGQMLLHDVSFAVAAGLSTVVLGPNGAGKSLLLRLCHGLLQPSSGRIAWLGPCALQAARCQAMVFQRPVLLRRSVAANILYALRIQGVQRREWPSRLDEALEMAGLTHLAGRHARVLSGGEQQRVALARACAARPEVLFLDEPTASLDPAATRTVEEVIQRFCAVGTKIIMTTHDLGQARRLADEVVFLHQGRLVEKGPAAQFFEAPTTHAAQAFIRGELLW